jgi:putative SOS response-associated peptidase YedK
MCRRYNLHSEPKLVVSLFAADLGLRDWKRRYNIDISQPDPIVRPAADGPGREVALARWGLIPFWSKTGKMDYATFNARAETVATLASYREPFKGRRCLIPASGFYEWLPKSLPPKDRTPYNFAVKDGRPFALAGLWDRWEGEGHDGPAAVESFSMVTCEANELLREHERMPVVLHPADYDLWLDPAAPAVELHALLRPYDAADMQWWQVPATVNNPKNDGPECLAPVA